MSVIEEKKALRTYIRQTERTLDPSYKAESSEAICRCVLALEEYRAAGTVFAFAGTVHEIDTSLLLKETLAAGKTLVLPRCAEGHALDLCVVTSMDELVPGMYGILEPKADCALVTPADIDFAVVPCLSFDLQLRAADQSTVFTVAGAGARADIQAAFGGDLVELCRTIGLGLGGRGQAPCGGCCVDGIGQPLFEPYIIAVLKLQLQIVGAVRLLVGVGGRQEIGAHTAGDVRALEKYLRRDAACLIRAAHPTTCFHGGRASPTSSAGSGSFSTIPAGKV